MRILLTGPSGSIGIQTLRSLLDIYKEHEIILLDTKSELTTKTLEPFKESATLYYGDLRDPSTLEEPTKNIDFAIHLAAIIPPLADQNTQLAHEVNVNGTKNLLDQLKKNSSSVFFMYASSVSVYGDRLLSDGIKIGDELKPSVGDYYAVTKIEAESLVINSGLDYTIFRLSGVMGPRPGEDPSKIEPLMFHMPLDTKYEFVTTRDCGLAFAKAINHQKSLSKKIYNLSGGEACRVIFRDFLKHNFEISGIDLDKFPKYSFAEKNFHCAYYEDAHLLNDILDFQRDSLESYYKWVDPKSKPLQKLIVKLFQKQTIKKIAAESDVLRAVKENNEELIDRFLRKNPNK